ncbi:MULTISPECIES: enoyl-[acyl-carrier-protein] reductase FabK [Fusobacterium]|jgi:enoyl-[acyl-carrier protein] reductase II|uniref:Enoyl-[acyl-carrier-protein] reductase FabK n=2 Tax=Fusobacterium mortiferum TaxID=850 RepID=A0A414PWN8_FUSMR|nr:MULTISPECIES: enoyl-[acyl-carrier-protein] reductase FabK [Fusobacterium]AVQ18734.1 enoyl-[acyl-carrier-protein] reductase FabK [Fusobacterium mortiferum ATCC 9817]EEO34977.1 putative enoyl-[acyl-carrier-protein] reductase II [Fusobacterium mortiferum ATCC 9817]MCF2627629.1 enoyl-[acyl-carrier-protein] reductase FabK [Fusobacterium mortiferum]MCF2699148.1 enoyl-[acyl-carrier-protein] reductase FabK [Fusobacterium mortiferum]MCI6382647.1 enoyl-[acyl-carrier-protein] reductase FabK [Fusobacte
MENNKICKLLGIKYPIFQGAMAWIANGNLAGHVSKDGGLGIIAGGGMPVDILREEIRKVKSITSNPFGVNLMLMMADVEKQIEVCIEEGVPVVTTGAGNPGPYMERLKAAGIKVIPVVASVALAKRMEKIGADAVIAEGMEGGGHIGTLTTMSLVPQVVEAVNIPVIAAGGIAGGKQFLAALSLGAEGIQVGTKFLVANECTVHENYKKVILKAKDRSTVSTGNYTGHPVRVIENKFAKQILEMEKVGTPKEEIEKLGTGRLRLAVVDGDVENGSVMAGQVAAMVNEPMSTKEILEGFMRELEEEKVKLAERMNSWK